MRIKFVVNRSDFLRILSGREKENFVVLNRDNGFFQNRAALKDIIQEELNNPNYLVDVYTDDETLLAYAPYDEKERVYKVDILFEDLKDFIPLWLIHPNLRYENNLTEMYQRGIFFEDWLDYKFAHELAIQETKNIFNDFANDFIDLGNYPDHPSDIEIKPYKLKGRDVL